MYESKIRNYILIKSKIGNNDLYFLMPKIAFFIF